MVSDWPDTPFEESMFGRDVIIHCPDEDAVRDLFRIFSRHGVRWAGNQSMTVTFWSYGRTNMCYRVDRGLFMRHGDIRCYSESRYDNCTKCTFYGIDTPDFDVASDDELRALFNIGVNRICGR